MLNQTYDSIVEGIEDQKEQAYAHDDSGYRAAASAMGLQGTIILVRYKTAHRGVWFIRRKSSRCSAAVRRVNVFAAAIEWYEIRSGQEGLMKEWCVDWGGLEPPTSCVRGKHSTAELPAQPPLRTRKVCS